MSSRRKFLKSIAPLAAAISVPATAADSQDLCRFYADRLAEAMKERHGGDWSIQVNHQTACAIIARL